MKLRPTIQPFGPATNLEHHRHQQQNHPQPYPPRHYRLDRLVTHKLFSLKIVAAEVTRLKLSWQRAVLTEIRASMPLGLDRGKDLLNVSEPLSRRDMR